MYKDLANSTFFDTINAPSEITKSRGSLGDRLMVGHQVLVLSI